MDYLSYTIAAIATFMMLLRCSLLNPYLPEIDWRDVVLCSFCAAIWPFLWVVALLCLVAHLFIPEKF